MFAFILNGRIENYNIAALIGLLKGCIMNFGFLPKQIEMVMTGVKLKYNKSMVHPFNIYVYLYSSIRALDLDDLHKANGINQGNEY